MKRSLVLASAVGMLMGCGGALVASGIAGVTANGLSMTGSLSGTALLPCQP